MTEMRTESAVSLVKVQKVQNGDITCMCGNDVSSAGFYPVVPMAEYMHTPTYVEIDGHPIGFEGPLEFGCVDCHRVIDYRNPGKSELTPMNIIWLD